MEVKLSSARTRVQACLDGSLSDHAAHEVVVAMRYALNGGKRLRAFLAMESAALFDISNDVSVWPAAAIESMHAYSLVHDDLPAMDDDDLRRGQPTVHKKWDDATAILVGDALQTHAFELLSSLEFAVSSDVRVDLIGSLSRASGAHGMVLGQAMDIAAETASTPLNLKEITALQDNKTGALIAWSSCVGARLAKDDVQPFETYAKALGLAFQIHDDVLDVVGCASKTGKAVGKDADAGKATFVSLLGLEGAKSRATALVDEACDALSAFGPKAETLRDVARFVISRDS